MQLLTKVMGLKSVFKSRYVMVLPVVPGPNLGCDMNGLWFTAVDPGL